MKKIHLLLLGVTLCLFSACHNDIWDAIDGLDSRVTKLEELCKEMNTNITSLQTIVDVLQSNDFITSIVEIKKDGKVVGYTITFGKHDPITIYHGQNGKDGQNGQDGQNGADGKDGITPVIGVAQDTDGVYYWTLNGEWLLDDNGNKLPVSGKDGKDGVDGKDGQDGTDGKDGITPLLKIENGFWYISYDNGATWTESGKATGEDGKDGQNGTDGKDGQDGANGQDGVTPLLKIENGYWYISYDNGATWAQLGKATGEDGKDGANGTNGTDGKDGQDGANGSNGQDGITPQLKIENGYWYVSYDNGATWTQFGKATGADGQDGQNGTDGKDGQDGKDGVTPQLKIEEGYWFISYDNGTTWTQLGKATGEDGKDGVDGEDGKDGQNGADGKDGQDGDSMFQSVTQDENYVYFTLADGTVIKIAKGSSGTEAPNPDDIIEFTDFNVRLALVELGVDTNKDGEISYVEAASVTRLDFSSHKFTSFREFKYFTNLQAVSYYNTGVREIVFPENGVDSILDNAFQGVKLKYLKITEGTKYIGTKAFYNSTIENLILPNSITVIGENAFVGSAIKSYVFPSTITYMPRGSFAECNNLETFTFPENYDGDPFLFGLGEHNGNVASKYSTPPACVYWNVIEYNQSLYGEFEHLEYTCGLVAACNKISWATTFGPDKPKSVVFGNKVKTIPNYLCAYMKGLTDVSFSNSITHIGEKAFAGCSSLPSITISDNVTSIGKYAFEYCSALTTVTIGASITEIGGYAFNNCNQLIYIYCKATTPPSRGTSCFPSSIETIYVPEESVDEYKTLWGWATDKIVGYNFE